MVDSRLRNVLYFKKAETASSWKDLGLVILALVYSGNPAPGRMFPVEPQLVLLTLFFGFLLIRRTRHIFSLDFIIVASIFATILLIQCIGFSFYPFVTMAGFFVRLFIGYALIRLVHNLPLAFVRAMVGLALLSCAFYIPYLLLSAAGISVEGIISRVAELLGTASITRRPLFLHTFFGDFSPRNFGMFWEPGAFQGYLILALIFLAFIKNDMSQKQYVYSLLILCAAVLSTLSTTGYIALILIPFLHYDWRAQQEKQTVFRILVGVYLVLPLLIGGGFYAYKTLPFLEEKINKQLDVLDRREGSWHRGRIGSIVFDWEYIQKRPLTGWGLHSNTRYSLHPGMESSEGMGNGMSDFTAKFGIIGFLTWFIAVYLGFWRLSGGNRLAAMLICGILLLELQGECFLGFPIFIGLAFLSSSAAPSVSRGIVIVQSRPKPLRFVIDKPFYES
ncbi:MAG: hypothetical protein JXA82_14225 [Sedimentisphaerales bacterium]|nr:hypothetical protein [Sedimentisphaerales bacterium]